MDEKVLFSKEPVTQAPAPVQEVVTGVYGPEKVAEASMEPPAQVALTPPVVQQSPAISDTPLPPPPSDSFLSGKLKFILGGVVLLIVIALLAVFVLSRANKEKPTGNVTLTYWGLFEDPQVMNVLINDFHKSNPTISVTYVKKDIENYRKSLVTQISNGKGPDIYRFHNSWTGMMKDYLSPLSDSVVAPDDFKKNYFSVIQQDMVRNGALYGLPLGVDTLSLYVNTEMFKASGYSVPQTWDEFVQIAKNLTVKDQSGVIKTSGAALGTYDNIAHAPDIIALLMAQNGVDFSNFAKSQAASAQALEFYTSFARDEGNSWDSSMDPSLTAFAKGNLAMYFGYSWDIFAIKALSPDLDFTTHPVPNLPERKLAIASYWAEGVSAKSSHQKEAMLFMQYLAKKETLQKFYSEVAKTRLFGEPYPRSDLAGSLASNPLVAPFVAQASYATSSYFSGDTSDDGINAQMNGYLGNAVRGNASAESSIETLNQGVLQVLTQYGQ